MVGMYWVVQFLERANEHELNDGMIMRSEHNLELGMYVIAMPN